MTPLEDASIQRLIREAKACNLKHNPLCAKLVATPLPTTDLELSDWLALAGQAHSEEMRPESGPSRKADLRRLATAAFTTL